MLQNTITKKFVSSESLESSPSPIRRSAIDKINSGSNSEPDPVFAFNIGKCL